MPKVVNVLAKPNSRLSVVFDDGVKGEVDLSDRLFGPMFEPLSDPSFFARVFVDAQGVVCWPNEADLAPDALYRKIAESKIVT